MAKKKNEKLSEALKGNKNAVGNNGGRPLKFENAELLKEQCDCYFKWADENPWIKNEAIKGGDMAGTIMRIPTQRPYTLIALCHHLGISTECWYDYEQRVEFSEITMRVREKIDNQQFEGGMVGAFNSSLVARRLGLGDKKTLEGGDSNKPIHSEITTKVIFEDYTDGNNS